MQDGQLNSHDANPNTVEDLAYQTKSPDILRWFNLKYLYLKMLHKGAR